MNASVFSALAEPTRLQIVELLRDEPRSVNHLAQLLNIRQPQASKHLRTLSQAGLVTAKPVAQQRLYQLNPDPFFHLEDWVGSFHQHWDQKLTNLESFLKKD